MDPIQESDSHVDGVGAGQWTKSGEPIVVGLMTSKNRDLTRRPGVVPLGLRTLLGGRPVLSEILGNTSWLLAERGLRMAVGLVIGVWVARYLGPRDYGFLSYALALTGMFAALATLGLDTVIVREIVGDLASKGETLGTSLLLRCLAGSLSLACALGAVTLLRRGDSLSRTLVAILSVGTLFQALDIIALWFQSQVQSKYSVCARVAALLVVSALRVALIRARAPLPAFALAISMEYVLGAVALVVVYRLRGQAIGAWRFARDRAKRLLRSGWPLIVSGLAITVYMKIDQIMIAEMVGEGALGVFSAATRLSELWYLLPMAIVPSALPSIVSARSSDARAYYRRLQALFDLMVSLALLVAVPVTPLAGRLVVALYGARYAEAGPILAIHVWAGIFVFLGVAQSAWDIAEDLTQLAMIRTICGMLAKIALNVILLPHYGAVGAAISAVLAYGVSGCLANLLDRRTQPILRRQIRALLLLDYWQKAVKWTGRGKTA